PQATGDERRKFPSEHEDAHRPNLTRQTVTGTMTTLDPTIGTRGTHAGRLSKSRAADESGLRYGSRRTDQRPYRGSNRRAWTTAPAQAKRLAMVPPTCSRRGIRHFRDRFDNGGSANAVSACTRVVCPVCVVNIHAMDCLSCQRSRDNCLVCALLRERMPIRERGF